MLHNARDAGSGVKVMTFDLLWSSLAPRPGGTGCESEASSCPVRTVFCFVMSGQRAPPSSRDPEAGGQSVTRSRPRRTCAAPCRVSWWGVTMHMGWPCEGGEEQAITPASYGTQDTCCNWRQFSIDWKMSCLFILRIIKATLATRGY